MIEKVKSYELARIYFAIGSGCESNDKDFLAIKYYELSLNQALIISGYLNIGDYSRVIEYSEALISPEQYRFFYFHISITLHKLAEMYNKVCMYDEARRNLKTILEVDDKLLPKVVGKLEFYDFSYHCRAVFLLSELHVKCNDLEEATDILCTKFKYFTQHGQPKVALVFIRKCFEIVQNLNPDGEESRRLKKRKIGENLNDLIINNQFSDSNFVKLIAIIFSLGNMRKNEEEEFLLLEAEYLKLELDYHDTLCYSSSLTADNENQTGLFFVKLLSFMDKLTLKSLRKFYENTKEAFFPHHTSRKAFFLCEQS